MTRKLKITRFPTPGFEPWPRTAAVRSEVLPTVLRELFLLIILRNVLILFGLSSNPVNGPNSFLTKHLFCYNLNESCSLGDRAKNMSAFSKVKLLIDLFPLTLYQHFASQINWFNIFVLLLEFSVVTQWDRKMNSNQYKEFKYIYDVESVGAHF